MGSMKSLLIIAGTMGAGKTTILGEASDILAMRGIAHAAIDLDMLGLAHLPSGKCSDAVMYRNLGSVCENYASLGVSRLLIARAIEDRAELEMCNSVASRSEEHTSELQSPCNLVCRLLLEKKKDTHIVYL